MDGSPEKLGEYAHRTRQRLVIRGRMVDPTRSCESLVVGNQPHFPITALGGDVCLVTRSAFGDVIPQLRSQHQHDIGAQFFRELRQGGLPALPLLMVGPRSRVPAYELLDKIGVRNTAPSGSGFQLRDILIQSHDARELTEELGLEI